DMPALLCAVLSVKGPGLLAEVFDRVIDNGKMLMNFVQMIRSGVAGRKSLGSLPKRMVRNWLEARDDAAGFPAAIRPRPAMNDIIKMVHPRPKTPSRAALYAYLTGRGHDGETIAIGAADSARVPLPELVRAFEAFKRGATKDVPDVPFQMLTALNLSKDDWI